MSPPKKLFEIYAECMKSHGHGHGFYEPESANDVRPGLCGYINDGGQWQHILDLNDRKTLKEEGYIPPSYLVKASSAESIWKDMRSDGVRRNKMSLRLGADGTGAGVPLEASISFSLSSSMTHGAVLLCNNSVTRQGYAHEKPFQAWARVNAKTILQNCPDVKRYGFYVVMTTWTTTDVWTNAWTDIEESVSIGVKARVAAVGEVSPETEYGNAISGNGWIHPISRKDEQIVVFFKGIHLKFNLLPFPYRVREVRGAEESMLIKLAEDEIYEVEWESIGGE